MRRPSDRSRLDAPWLVVGSGVLSIQTTGRVFMNIPSYPPHDPRYIASPAYKVGGERQSFKSSGFVEKAKGRKWAVIGGAALIALLGGFYYYSGGGSGEGFGGGAG